MSVLAGYERVLAELRTFVTDNFLYLHPDVELDDRDDLLAMGIIDSLGFVELVEEVQARYDVTVDDLDITEENFGSLAAMASYVCRKQAA
jgi:acyl carrier protein